MGANPSNTHQTNFVMVQTYTSIHLLFVNIYNLICLFLKKIEIQTWPLFKFAPNINYKEKCKNFWETFVSKDQGQY